MACDTQAIFVNADIPLALVLSEAALVSLLFVVFDYLLFNQMQSKTAE